MQHFSRSAIFALAAVAAPLALPTAANAATQGSLGATSTGTVAISASVPSRVRITSLGDVAFTNQDPGTAASNAQDVCVWSNTATKGYSVTATGSGASSAFTLANGANTVPYSVQWNNAAGQTAGTALVAGTASTGKTSLATQNQCSSGPADSASLVVGISTTDLGTMQAGVNYTGTLTLVVAPE
jgi:hypothetical protein